MDSKIISYVQDYVNNMKGTLDMLSANTDLEAVINTLLEAHKNGNKVIAFGNGGSGCLASHLIQDLAKHTIVSDNKSEVVCHKRFKAICLNESISTMTTWANDVGFNRVFSEQLINLVEPWDVVIGITGSGNTENIIKALEVANSKGAVSIAFAGGGKIKDIAQISLVIESDINYCIEDALSSVVHIITDIIRTEIQE